MKRRQYLASLITVVLALSFGCGAQPDSDVIDAKNTSTLTQQLHTLTAAGTLSASPSIVRILPGALGSSRICFTTSAAWGDVVVSPDGGPEKLFLGGPSGSCDSATWIQIGHTYAFRLYDPTNRAVPIASATVIGVEDNPCAHCRPGTACYCAPEAGCMRPVEMCPY